MKPKIAAERNRQRLYRYKRRVALMGIQNFWFNRVSYGKAHSIFQSYKWKGRRQQLHIIELTRGMHKSPNKFIFLLSSHMLHNSSDSIDVWQGVSVEAKLFGGEGGVCGQKRSLGEGLLPAMVGNLDSLYKYIAHVILTRSKTVVSATKIIFQAALVDIPIYELSPLFDMHMTI